MLIRFFGPRRWFAGDVGGGGGATTGNQPKPAAAPKPSSQPKPAAQPAPEPAPDPKGDPAQPPEPAPEPAQTFTKAELEAQLQAQRDEIEAERKRQDREAAAQKKREDEQTLAKNQEWEKLANDRGTELEQLRPLAELATELAAESNAALDAEIGKWPEELRNLDPGKDKLLERLRWAKQMRPVAAKMAAAPPPAPDTEGGKGSHKPARPKSDSPPAGTKYRFQSANDVPW